MKQWVGLATAGAIVVLAGCSAPQEAAAPVTVTATETSNQTVVMTTIRPSTTRIYASYTEEVEVTVTESVVQTVATTEMVTVTESAAGVAAPAGQSFSDGTHLIGTEIPAGRYKCSDGDDNTRWIVEDSNGETLGIDFSTVAFVSADGFSVQFKECAGQWDPVG